MHQVALVSAAVGPYTSALAVHPVVYPLALVLSVVSPSAWSLEKDTTMHAAIWPLESARAVLLPMQIGANVLVAIVPLLHSQTMLPPVLELANVLGVPRNEGAMVMAHLCHRTTIATVTADRQRGRSARWRQGSL